MGSTWALVPPCDFSGPLFESASFPEKIMRCVSPGASRRRFCLISLMWNNNENGPRAFRTSAVTLAPSTVLVSPAPSAEAWYGRVVRLQDHHPVRERHRLPLRPGAARHSRARAYLGQPAYSAAPQGPHPD